MDSEEKVVGNSTYSLTFSFSNDSSKAKKPLRREAFLYLIPDRDGFALRQNRHSGIVIRLLHNFRNLFGVNNIAVFIDHDYRTGH